MAASCVRRCVSRHLRLSNLRYVPCRFSNTLSEETIEGHRYSKLSNTRMTEEPQSQIQVPRDYKYVFPEFLPVGDWKLRDKVLEKMERRDMMRRREVLDIPEFYVGSILAVTVSDPHAPGQKNRFVGLCISRKERGLRANFTLRNVVDKQGVEILYELYNPTIQKIEVLKLEKRLDDELYYLRDAPPEYSTVPFDMAPLPHPSGATVPVNTIKVKLNARPWHERWERKNLQGVEDVSHMITEKMKKQAQARKEPWEDYDLMKEYRRNITDEEADEIMGEVYQHQKAIDKKRGPRKILHQEIFQKFKRQR